MNLEACFCSPPGIGSKRKDKRTGRRWRGTVDVVAPELGKLWIYAELGERKLIDMEVRNISRAPDRPGKR